MRDIFYARLTAFTSIDVRLVYRQFKILKFSDICYYNLVIYVYKALNNMLVTPLEFNIRNPPVYNLRNVPLLVVPNLRTDQSQRFILHRGSIAWNNLPNHPRESVSVASLKRKLKAHLLLNYD